MRGTEENGASPASRIVARFLGALNAHDPAGAAACVAPDFVNEHTSFRGQSLSGRLAYLERLPSFLEDFSDLRYDVEDLIAEGDRVAVAYTMHCSWRGDAGAPAAVVVRGSFWFAVAGGLITHRRDYWDGEDFARQVAQSRGGPPVDRAAKGERTP